MPELIDAASEESKQVVVRTGGVAGRAAFEVAMKLTQGTAGTLRNVLDGIIQATQHALHELQTTGKVSVKTFGATINGTREMVDISDKAVARELEGSLKRYGVTFAIEKDADGARTFHVQGKDVQVVEKALRAASQRVDEKIARTQTRNKLADKIDDGVKKKQTERDGAKKQTKERTQSVSVPKADDDGQHRRAAR